MRPRSLHTWDLTPQEAVAVQRALADQVVRTDAVGPVKTVAGIDVGFEHDGTIARAAVAVLEFPGLKLVGRAVARAPCTFPYRTGLLSFRELPAIIAACEQLETTPDLVLYDGQGIAHPRRCGIASHLGLLFDIPVIGVAKTRLIGAHAEPESRRGAQAVLEQGGETIGCVLRTRDDTRPLYVSIGHRVSLPTAIRWVLACTTRYRLPETTRWAHHLASIDEHATRLGATRAAGSS